jgi:hypothetical protein
MRRYGLSRFSRPGTQVRQVSVDIAEATVDATRTFAAADRIAEVEAPLEVWLDAQAYLVAAPSYLVPGMRRFGLSRFSRPGTQVRQVSVDIAEATVDATRSFAAADRIAEVEAPLEVWLDAQAYLVAAPSYLVPGMRRFGLSRFSIPGTLQSRHMAVEGAEGTIVATRDPLVAADRLAAIAGLGGYLAGRSYVVPDVSGGVSVAFIPHMTGPDIQFKRGSTLPVYQITLYRQDSPTTPFPIAGAEVRLVAKSWLAGEIVIDRSLEILDPTTGLCQLTREADEFHGGEVCQAEIVVTFGDGGILILPTTGYYSLVIEKSLV